MLKHTFIHLKGVGEVAEKRLWSNNIMTHNDAIKRNSFVPSQLLKISEAKQKLEDRDALYFHNILPSKERWRMFGEFHDSVAYLDIETTGLYGCDDIITTIALYDGIEIKHYVNGKNLKDFKNDIKKYKLLVTYNGTNFDLPFIQGCLRVSMNYAHIDLRYVLQALGYTGGLKGCENQVGFVRNSDVGNIDGKFAVYLWKYYKKYESEKALDTLLSYNIEDVLSLEKLILFAYNKKISKLMQIQGTIPEKEQPKNPFMADTSIVNEIRNGIEKYSYTYLTEKQKNVPKESSSGEDYYTREFGDIIYSLPNMDFFKDNHNKKNIPSKAKTQWVYAMCKKKSNHYPESIKGKGGKWLIFVPEKDIDKVWMKIRKVMLKNELVRYAKCSTILKNTQSGLNKTDCVMCIYTYDYRDEIDVRVVRYKLKKLGFRDKIYYKTDVSTNKGNYSDFGHKRTWLYAE